VLPGDDFAAASTIFRRSSNPEIIAFFDFWINMALLN
jgi:hypothetical protein